MTDDVSEAFVALVRGRPALALATVDARGLPAAGYVPFAIVGGAIVFVASALSVHGVNLTVRREASMLVTGEPTDDPFARPRVTFDGRVRPCEPAAPTAAVWDALGRRHGATVAMLRTLADFTAYACAPTRARLVMGFASAHELDEREVRDLLNATGAR